MMRLKVTLVHDWLTGMRGGERCLEAFGNIWPEAPIHTLFCQPDRISAALRSHTIRTSALARLPFVNRYYRNLLPALPWAIESISLPPSDVVISLSHCVAKGVRRPAGVPHICYCFTPMRYAWDLRDTYLAQFSALGRRLAGGVLDAARNWDRMTADRVTHYVAISRTIQQRIWNAYGRESVVIHPPVRTDYFVPSDRPRSDHYLCVSALVPYKRVDLAIEACRRAGRKLVVVGEGPLRADLERMAGPTVRFAGWCSDDELREHYRTARALLFPPLDDFGIVPVEAQACGCPVIALAAGGATETVVAEGARPTGVLFPDQNAECLAAAITEFEGQSGSFSVAACRGNAEQFGTPRFDRQITEFVDGVVRGRQVSDVYRWAA